MRLLFAFLSVVSLSLDVCSAQQPRPSTPPNILFILADDLGINDLHCYGRKDHHTPHLDQLAREGLRFTSAYTACSVCSPTRASILTGLNPARLRLTTFLPGRNDAVSQLLLHPKISQQLPDGVTTLPQHLKTAGYVSACIGKWHLGGKGSLPTDRGFDEYYPGNADTKPSSLEGGKGEYDLTGHAEQFMEKHKDKPFFLYVAHNNPHIPLAAQPELIARNKDAFNPTYAAMIETLDLCVGRLLAKLNTLGIAQNTLVVFTSDNGGLHVLEGGQTPTYNHPFRAGKGFLYEGGIRVPLIVRWPGKVNSGNIVTEPVISTDWTPTILGAAGITARESFDGINLVTLLTEQKTPAPRILYWHQPHYLNQGSRPMGAIRSGPWKLIEHYENGQLELFNLSDDVSERKDLSEREPVRVAQLRGKLESWRREAKVQENTPNPNYNPVAWQSCYGTVDVSLLEPDSNATTTSLRLKPWREAMNNAFRDPPTSANQGVIVLKANSAMVHGEKLRYEPEPEKDTIGYWANPNDWVEWHFAVNHDGRYAVELLQGAGTGSGGAIVEVTVGNQKLTHTVKETGHFQRFVPYTIGTIDLKTGNQALSIHAKSKPGFGVMDLRRVTLKAVPQ
jgi:arylsulfatase A-like enzyme